MYTTRTEVMRLHIDQRIWNEGKTIENNINMTIVIDYMLKKKTILNIRKTNNVLKKIYWMLQHLQPNEFEID